MNSAVNQYQDTNQQAGQQYYYNQGEQVAPPDDFAPTQAPLPKSSRPFVDPNAAGEVDPTAYPEPKEATHKIRGRSDVMEILCGNMKQELVFAKTFYFFFFSAFGSLFPLMAIYFKQMGLNPCQTGFLIGIRPFVEFIASPLWGSLADKFQKGKVMLLCAVGSWIVFTMAVGFVSPPAVSCVIFNGTQYILKDVDKNSLKKRSIDPMEYYKGLDVTTGQNQIINNSPVFPHFNYKQSIDQQEIKFPQVLPLDFADAHNRYKRDTPMPPNHVVGQSPQMVHYTVNYKDFNEAESWLSPPFSSIVYREADVQKVFFLIFLLVLLGEFFSCPAITLADTAVLTYLNDETDHYGSQRMFGSLGWGLSMFFMGIVLDHSVDFPSHPCGPHEKERNYTICFSVFSILMGCAFIVAAQFKFGHSGPVNNTIPLEEVKEPVDNGPRPWNEPKIPMQQTKTGRQQFEDAIGTIKTRIFANTMKEMPEWMVIMQEFKSLRCISFLFVAWWMGFGIGLIFSFLFWHLQDYGGTPTLFGIASVINHISEIFAYFYSFKLISQIGHVKVLCLGLLGNVLRFLYISWIQNPWWVLPFEFIQGITHAAVWAACCSYIAHNTKVELRSSAQGVLQGLHHGFGRGAGAIIGGILVKYFGTSVVFRIYGLISLLVLGVFIFIYFYKKDVGFQKELPPEEDPRQVAEEGTALAPHGAPASPMPRAHSSQRLNEQDQSGSYGTYSTNGRLDIPGGAGQPSTNPFASGAENPQGGQGGNYQYNTETTKHFDDHYMNLTYQNNYGIHQRQYGYSNYKGCPVKSPDMSPGDYEKLKNKFQAYNTLLNNYGNQKITADYYIEQEDKSITLNNPFVY